MVSTESSAQTYVIFSSFYFKFELKPTSSKERDEISHSILYCLIQLDENPPVDIVHDTSLIIFNAVIYLTIFFCRIRNSGNISAQLDA